jgi:quinoprotein glucose dehydrogenase
MHRFHIRVLLVTGALVTAVMAADTEPKPYTPNVRPASDEGVKAMKAFRLPPGVTGRLWAAEPLLANPVAFAFDEQGRCYVAETYRLHRGVTDNRNNMYWLDDDIASRTVEDRVAMYKKHAKNNFAKMYETDHDRVKLVEDTTGKGVADRATVFADGFKNAADGLGSGVLARKGNVYFTNIPDLWLLKDTKGAGKADVKKSLATGFGIHVAFIGHDMHGLRMGPDGKLYFSIGDRGLNVKTKEGRHLYNPDSGAVLRCDPDGSNLELVHIGLRNPQELAFDALGNLFTVDNNSDSGDRARLVQIVEGGDSGWRVGYQYGSSLSNRGPFNAEKIWHLQHAEQPAYIVPPLAHITSGPSGFCFNYGATALPERYKDHFFICDFHGSPGGSGIYSFAVKPKGASFEPVDGHNAFGGILATDCDFGPDGGFYVSDWVNGWGLTGKGRIYRFADAEADKNSVLAETKKLVAEGFDKRSIEELTKLLDHADLRVRQEAQFALADKGKDAAAALEGIAKNSKNRLPRLHALWALGQIGQRDRSVSLEALSPLVKDGDVEVRCQFARVLGRVGGSASACEKMMHDEDPRVRFAATLSLSQTLPDAMNTNKRAEVIGLALRSVQDLLRENADRDVYLRHAAVQLLHRFDDDTIAALRQSESASIRLGAVLALRLRRSGTVGAFLDDTDARVATEAARAIHDDPGIPTALPQLAERLSKPNPPEFLAWRALNAHFRLGKPENANALAAVVARAGIPDKLRVEALNMLGDWAKPGRRDRVTGLTQDLGTRDGTLAVAAIRANLGSIFAGPETVRKSATSVAAKLGIKEVAPVLFDIAIDAKQPATTRIEAMRALDALKDSRLEKATEAALADADPRLRTEGRRVLAKTKPAAALPLLVKAAESGTPVDQQGAFAILADLKLPEADDTLSQALSRLLKKELPAEVYLDLLDAAGKRQAIAGIKDKLAAFEKTRDPKDELAKWREALVGGDAERGRLIFLNKAEVTCQKCHKAQGVGGDVGPDLAGIGTRQKRDYLLESIVLPNKQIAKGYETVVIQLTNGKSVTGILKGDKADKVVRVMTFEGQLLTLRRQDIDEMNAGKSAMPEDVVKHLSKAELRDLVEFLSSLKDQPKGK